MERNKLNSKLLFLTFAFCLTAKLALSQDTTEFRVDTTWALSTYSFSWASACVEYSFEHSPTKNDSLVYNKYKNLVSSDPSEKNFRKYYSLACSLWDLGRLAEAENMFHKIILSSKPFYTETYYHSSDIPGETTNTYGYGSYTSNFKNYSCRYLTRIYLERKQYDQALKFLELADRKYVVKQNCGTGHRWYRQEVDGLYGLCYDGLGMYDTIIAKYISDYSDYYNGILVKAIKKKYSSTEISDYLIAAEKSIICVVDTFQSSSFTTYGYKTKDEKTVESRYTSGTATINLFGTMVMMPTPILEDGDVITRERFLKEFQESGFYKALTENDSGH